MDGDCVRCLGSKHGGTGADGACQYGTGRSRPHKLYGGQIEGRMGYPSLKDDGHICQFGRNCVQVS